MSLISDLKMKNKIILILIFPLLGALYFAANGIVSKVSIVKEVNALQPLTELSRKISAMVHELQKERGATGLFVGSKGAKFAAELPAQRVETDKKVAELKSFLSGFDSARYGADFKKGLSHAEEKLGRLETYRASAAALSISADEVLGYYTELVTSFFHLIADITNVSTSSEITNLLITYRNLLEEKEYTGIERGILASVFGANKFGGDIFLRFVSVTAAQKIHHEMFLDFAPEEYIAFYKDKLKGESMEELARMRKIAHEKYLDGNFGIDPGQWFNLMTDKVNLLKQVEDKLSYDINTKMSQHKSSAYRALAFYLLLSLIVLFSAVIFAWFVSRIITRSLSDTVEVVNTVAAGDLTRGIQVYSQDELGVLSQSMNKMVHSFSGIINGILVSSNSVVTELDSLKLRTEKTADGAQKQSSQALQIATAAEEMSQTILDIARNAEMASGTSAGAMSIAEQGREVTVRAIEAAERVYNATLELSSMVEKVNHRSTEIGDIVTVIKDIADQTNLLALNAAIEAARAGEQGRGFAVVADEVRKLAERTIKATGEISGKITAVQEDSERTIISMGVTSEEVASATGHIKEVGGSLTSIVEAVQKVKDQITNIATAVEEQSAASDEIAGNIENTALIAKEIHAMTDDAMLEVSRLVDIAEKLKESTSGFKIGSNGNNGKNGNHSLSEDKNEARQWAVSKN